MRNEWFFIEDLAKKDYLGLKLLWFWWQEIGHMKT